MLATLDISDSESEDGGNVSGDDNWNGSPVSLQPNNHGVIPESADTDTPVGMLHTLREDVVFLKNQMASLELKVDNETRCNHEEAWESRVAALRMTLKYKLLDALRRPIRKHKVKDPKPFNTVITESAIHVSTDCDAELLHHVLQHFSQRYFSNLNDVSGAWIYPRSYHVLQQDLSKQPVAMVFATFRILGDSLEIFDRKYVASMMFRSTNTPDHTFLQIVGKIQYSAADEALPLNVFDG